MRISSLGQVFRLPTAVGSKRNEGEGDNGRNEYDPRQTRKDDPDEGPTEDSGGQAQQERLAKRKEIDEAARGFAEDAVTQAHGLRAVVEGTGPGLRVSVQDVNGTTLRQFTGEEFLRLRQGVAKNSASPRGKILDQKL